MSKMKPVVSWRSAHAEIRTGQKTVMDGINNLSRIPFLDSILPLPILIPIHPLVKRAIHEFGKGKYCHMEVRMS